MSRLRVLLSIVLLAATAGCMRLGRRPPAPPPPVAGPIMPADSIPLIRMDSIVRRVAGAPVESAFVAPPAAPRPQERPAERCLLEIEGDRSQFIKDPISQKYTSYFGGGFTGRCPTQGITITADSAEFYDQNQLYYLLGNVKYREKRVHLDADKLTYFRAEERLLAEGNVYAVMPDSTSMTGPRAEYYRAVRGVRARARMVATMRPTLKLYEADSLGQRRGEPVLLTADNINGEGDSVFVAWGTVQLDRSDLMARGDSAELDNRRQFARLMKQPYVESKGKDAFTLRGKVIDVFARNKLVERVVARDSAVAVSRELTLSSDTIDLRVKDNQLQRAFAFGPGAASAVTPERTVIADSLDVRMPGQRIREMYAVRAAYAESDPDSTKVRSAERELRGTHRRPLDRQRGEPRRAPGSRLSRWARQLVYRCPTARPRQAGNQLVRGRRSRRFKEGTCRRHRRRFRLGDFLEAVALRRRQGTSTRPPGATPPQAPVTRPTP